MHYILVEDKFVTGKREIVEIKFNKKGQAVVQFGAESLTIPPNVFTNYYLFEGKEISEDDIKKIKKEIQIETLYKYGLRLACKMSYSTKEVKEKLIAKSDDKFAYKSIIARLKEAGFLDDESYAIEYKEEKEKACYGKNRILDTLRYDKGISDSIIQTLKFKDEEEHASKFLHSIEKKYSRESYSEKKRKVHDALLRRGFDEHVIYSVLDELTRDRGEETKNLEKLATTALKKYKAKYNEREARQKAFESLLRKGYSVKDINKALEDLEND